MCGPVGREGIRGRSRVNLQLSDCLDAPRGSFVRIGVRGRNPTGLWSNGIMPCSLASVLTGREQWRRIITQSRAASGRLTERKKTALSKSGTKPDKAEGEPPHTEITWRDYLHDAAFLVALALKPDHLDDNRDLLSYLATCLQNPKWPLYLGRKACVPSRPILDRLAHEYQDIESAFRAEPWDASRTLMENKPYNRTGQEHILLAWLECPNGEYERQDSIHLNQARFYDFRRCRRIEVETRLLPRGIV